MIFTGLLTAVGFVAIAAKFSPTFLRRLLCFGVVIDIALTFGLPIFMSGTYVGMMTAVVTGLCVSAVLFVTEGIIGYEKPNFSNGLIPTWTESPVSSRWTWEKAGVFCSNRAFNVSGAIDSFTSGWKSTKGVYA